MTPAWATTATVWPGWASAMAPTAADTSALKVSASVPKTARSPAAMAVQRASPVRRSSSTGTYS